jgi:hypothetical protein
LGPRDRRWLGVIRTQRLHLASVRFYRILAIIFGGHPKTAGRTIAGGAVFLENAEFSYGGGPKSGGRKAEIFKGKDGAVGLKLGC